MNRNSSSSSLKIAVIMPTYNGQKFLKEQIDSILKQTFCGFELYVFDDASTDRTIDIIKSYSSKDPRIKLVENPSRKGVIGNVNKALSQVDADIYFLADQDDIWLPEKMQKQIDLLRETNTLMTFSNLELMNEDGSPMGVDFWQSQGISPSEAAKPEILAIKTMVTGCTIALKKELLKIALPIPSEATMHDHWLSFFASVQKRIEPLQQQLVKYRQHSNNVIGASMSNSEIRQKRYSGCKSYSDFKKKKYQAYYDQLVSLKAFKDRLDYNNLELEVLNKYIDFFTQLVNRHWLKALKISLKLKKQIHSNFFFRALLITFLFPLEYLFLKLNFYFNSKK